MKIAFFSPIRFSKKLGATKNRVVLAEALSELGWITDLIDNKQIRFANNSKSSEQNYTLQLKNYLIEHSSEYDVVLYEYDTLPFERALFCNSTLFVARPAILEFHLSNTKIRYDIKSYFSNFLKNIFLCINKEKYFQSKRLESIINISLTNCDIIQIQNTIDARILQNEYPQKEVLLVPNGIGKDRYEKLQATNRNFKELLSNPIIAHVGTFDFRKGAIDFISIIANLISQHPGIRFRFIGAKGLYNTEKSILNFFPKRLRKNIQIILEFEPEELPLILEDCILGVFPSYVESFGFGALEMMCSGLPVIGYKSPGPNDFLLPELQVEIGDKKNLIMRASDLLCNLNQIVEMSHKAKKVAEEYQWHLIAKEVDSIYRQKLFELRSSSF